MLRQLLPVKRERPWPCVAAILAVFGCGHAPTPKPKAVAIADPWIMTCRDAHETEPAYLTNGRLGIRFQRGGSGAAAPVLMTGQYDANEDIIKLPSPFRASWSGFEPASATDYSQSLDMRTGVLVTSWSQGSFSVRTRTVLSPTQAVVATRWDIWTKSATALDMDESKLGLYPQFLPDSSTDETRVFKVPLSPQVQILSAVRLPHEPGFSCYNLHILGTAPARRQTTIEQVWDFDPANNSKPIQYMTYEAVRNASTSEWSRRWKTDITVNGPSQDQQAIHSWLYYLRSSLSQGSGPDFSPMGLSSTLYKGHIFWDADAWIFPALVFIDPDGMKSLADYRLQEFPAAEVEAQGNGARYPWESAGSGQELAPLALRDEIHVTGDVAFMLAQATALGVADPTQAKAVIDAAAKFYISKATNGGRYLHIRNVRGPDEYHVGDDDLYTNCLAQWLSDRSKVGSPPFALPHDSTSLLSYANDPVRNYGQADAILAIYPLQNPVAEREARTMMLRFPQKTSPSSPAMTNSVEALIWARLGNADRAYADWLKSWQDFSQHPLGLFGEGRKKDRTYFQTGAAGCLQAVLYGFLGFRIDLQKDEQTVWGTQLDQGYWLSIKPHLPSAWKKVIFRNFMVLGKRPHTDGNP